MGERAAATMTASGMPSVYERLAFAPLARELARLQQRADLAQVASVANSQLNASAARGCHDQRTQRDRHDRRLLVVLDIAQQGVEPRPGLDGCLQLRRLFVEVTLANQRVVRVVHLRSEARNGNHRLGNKVDSLHSVAQCSGRQDDRSVTTRVSAVATWLRQPLPMFS